MKNKIAIVCSFLLLGLLAGAALAIPPTVASKAGDMQIYGGEVIQNSQATAPKAAGAVCVTKTIHNAGDIATFRLYSSNRWYQKADWKAVNSATGADFIVQRKLGANSSGMPGANGSLTVNREYTTYKLATFGNATSASITVCQDRQ